MASLFDKELIDMPLFNPDGSQGLEVMKYFKDNGYDYGCFSRREKGHKLQSGVLCPTIEEAAKYDGGVNGYFYASVPSQTFEGITHAVVVDIELNVVHDPNPNELALKLKPEDVISIITTGGWHINFDGEFVDE